MIINSKKYNYFPSDITQHLIELNLKMKEKSMLMFVDSASVAYTNMTSNFKGMSHTNDDKIDMYFEYFCVTNLFKL